MEKYLIKIKLLTDTVFGSGYSVPGFVDSDVLYDDYGFPYINGKTLKGKLGEMATVFVNMTDSVGELKEYNSIFQQKKDKLLEVSHDYNHDKLKFSDCEMSKDVRTYFKLYMQDAGIASNNILEALTHIETLTSIDYDRGVAKKNSLRNYRIINNGLSFYSQIYSPTYLDEEEKIILASACSLLRHLGSYETKGKGHVETSLFFKEKDVTQDYIKLLEKKVKANV